MTPSAWYWRFRRAIFFFQARWFSVLSFLLLDNVLGSRLRVSLLRTCGVKAGTGCIVRGNMNFQEGFNLTLGNNVFINTFSCFDTSAPITFEDNVQVAFQVTFITGGHEIGTHDSRAGAHAPRPIHIGKGSWIGARAVILPGVTIGEGCVVAAGAVVTKDVPPDSLVAGVPAKVIRSLDAT